jgi:hypothetical protein
LAEVLVDERVHKKVVDWAVELAGQREADLVAVMAELLVDGLDSSMALRLADLRVARLAGMMVVSRVAS